MVELGDAGVLAGEPVEQVALGCEPEPAGIVTSVEDVDVPVVIAGPLEPGKRKEPTRHSCRVSLGVQVMPFLRVEPLAMVGDGQDVNSGGVAGISIGMARQAFAVGVTGVGVQVGVVEVVLRSAQCRKQQGSEHHDCRLQITDCRLQIGQGGPAETAFASGEGQSATREFDIEGNQFRAASAQGSDVAPDSFRVAAL